MAATFIAQAVEPPLTKTKGKSVFSIDNVVESTIDVPNFGLVYMPGLFTRYDGLQIDSEVNDRSGEISPYEISPYECRQ